MKKKDIKGCIIILIFIFIILVMCFIKIKVNKAKEFSYQKHLQDVAVNVDDTSVTLQELGYYIFVVEDFVDKQAKLYDSKNPTAYWNTHFSVGLDSAFVSEMAMDTVYETCICDMIYEQMAKAQGYQITDEEKQRADERAEDFYKKLTPKQIEKTGLTKEIVTKIEQRKVLVARFALDYVKTADFTGYNGTADDLLSSSGDYYIEKIKSQHKIQYNEKLKGNLPIGRITINCD